jgi:dihydroneopterin aldolase
MTDDRSVPDLIIIEKLELTANIGVPEEERSVPQRLTAHLVIEPLRHFENLGDEIGNAVDYADVASAVNELARNGSRRLLETLAEEVAGMILARFPVRNVQLELRKYILPDTSFVAVRISRES